MRGAIRRACTTGLVTAALAAGPVGCTGDSDKGGGDKSGAKSDAAVVKACADGTFTWSGVKKSDRLTGVSEMEDVGVGGGTLKGRLARVYTPRPSVKAQGPAVSSAEILFSLGKEIGEIDSDARTLADEDSGTTYAFTDVDVKAPALDSRISKIDGSGEFVRYAGVKEVAGYFRYTCPGGKATTGHARSWTVDINGILSCAEAVETDLGRDAARRSCEAGAAANDDA